MTDAARPNPLPGERAPFRDATGWYLGTGAFWFATSFKWFILLILLPVQLRQIVPDGEHNQAWGTVVSLGAIEAMIGPALFGWLSDRTRSRWGRRRPYVALGAALTAMALLFLGQARSLWMMVIGYLFLQISDDVATGPYASIVPDLVPESRRGRASALLSLLQLLAQIVAAVVGIALGKSPMTIYLLIALINIVCALIVLAVVREPAPPPLSAARDGFSLESWLAPWRAADFRWVWFTRFLAAAGFYTISTYAINFLADAVHGEVPAGAPVSEKVFHVGGIALHGALQAGIVAILLVSLAGAAITPWVGRRVDERGRKAVIRGAGWVMFLSIVPFALLRDYIPILVAAACFGLGYAAYLSASWALVSDILPEAEASAKDMGIWQASITAAQILVGGAGGLIDVGNRLRPGVGYTAAFLLAALAFLAGSLFVTRVRGSR